MNEYLNQYIGKTSSEKLLFDANKYLFEEKLKKASSSMMETCLVHVENPLTKEIIGIGGSTPNDLILDNWGLLFARHFRLVFNTDSNVILTQIGGTTETLVFVRQVASTNQFNNTLAGAGGGLIQIGSGTTTPARSDFTVSTPFITAPESGLVANTVGILDVPNGTVKVQAFLLAGGSGTINEAGQFGQWANSANIDKFFMIAHDLISPAVPFIINQTITIEYTWQL